jgi:chromosome segregation ATPase
VLSQEFAALQTAIDHQFVQAAQTTQDLQSTTAESTRLVLSRQARLYEQVINTVNVSTRQSTQILKSLSSQIDTLDQRQCDQLSGVGANLSHIQAGVQSLSSQYQDLSQGLKHVSKGNVRIEQELLNIRSDFRTWSQHHSDSTEETTRLLLKLRKLVEERSHSKSAIPRNASYSFRNGSLEGTSSFRSSSCWN